MSGYHRGDPSRYGNLPRSMLDNLTIPDPSDQEVKDERNKMIENWLLLEHERHQAEAALATGEKESDTQE
jgi:hypothetical protein